MAWASCRSHLVLLPWTALMAQAWPRAKVMSWSRQVSASQYQQCMHSQPTTRPSRKGCTALRKGSGAAGRVRGEEPPAARAGVGGEREPAGTAPPAEERGAAGG